MGEARSYTLTPGLGADAPDFGGGCANPPTGTARDIIFMVTLPGGTELDLSVDAPNLADPQLAIFEDPSCYQPANFCANDGGPGECEALRGDADINWHGNPTYVTVSEVVDSGELYTVSFRANYPQ